MSNAARCRSLASAPAERSPAAYRPYFRAGRSEQKPVVAVCVERVPTACSLAPSIRAAHAVVLAFPGRRSPLQSQFKNHRRSGGRPPSRLSCLPTPEPTWHGCVSEPAPPLALGAPTPPDTTLTTMSTRRVALHEARPRRSVTVVLTVARAAVRWSARRGRYASTCFLARRERPAYPSTTALFFCVRSALWTVCSTLLPQLNLGSKSARLLNQINSCSSPQGHPTEQPPCCCCGRVRGVWVSGCHTIYPARAEQPLTDTGRSSR